MNESENSQVSAPFQAISFLENQKRIILKVIRDIEYVCSVYRGIETIEREKEHILEDVRIALDTLENN